MRIAACSLIQSLMVAIAALTTPTSILNAAPPGYYTDQKVVYHNDGGAADNTAYFKRLLSINNHIAAVGKAHVEIRVVSHGAGVDLFQAAKNDGDLAKRIDDLKSNRVRFLVCANTLKERRIDWHQLYGVTEDDIVPSGVAELARSPSDFGLCLHSSVKVCAAWASIRRSGTNACSSKRRLTHRCQPGTISACRKNCDAHWRLSLCARIGTEDRRYTDRSNPCGFESASLGQNNESGRSMDWEI